MDYKTKYEKAFEKAKVVYHDHRKDKYWRDWLIELFPELEENESKDEKIRQAIIAYISYGQHCGVSNADMIAWLEKQAEKCNTNNVLPSLGNSQVQDILEDMGMLDDNGYCSHTAEEIFKAGMEYQYNLKHKAVSSVILDVELLTKVLIKHLYTCVNKTNTYVRSEEDNITLTELIAKIKADLNIE